MENKGLIEKDRAHVWHPFTQQKTAGDPLEIVRAQGVRLIASDGKEYIDANSSWWVNVHGHAHPHIAKELSEQFSRLDHVVFAGVTHPRAVELAERICGVLPEPMQKVFFSDNGSTAVEVALKMSFQYFHNNGNHRKRVLAMNGAYHGDTFGAMSVGQRGYFNEPFEPFFFDVDYIDFPDGENDVAILQRAQYLFESGEFAAMIVEPLVQGAAGMQMYSSEFLDDLCALAKANGVLVIFDEVMTGFGRTGKLFSADHCEVKPDIMCLSKGLTAGVLPLGLTVTTDRVYEAFLSEEKTKAFLHGHSFTANPMACAAACAGLDLFEKKETWKGIEQLIQWNEDFAGELISLDCIKTVRQTGTILAFEIETGESSSYFSNIRGQAYDYFLEQGVLLRPLGNVIFVNPPYCISEKEYGIIQQAILSFLEKL